MAVSIEDRSSHSEMRILSIQKIISALQKGFLTKNEIVSETGLSWGSCSTIINLLHDKEIVKKYDNNISSGRGRRTSEYHFNSGKYLLFGMEIKEDEILCSIINFGEKELYRNRFRLTEVIKPSNIAGLVSSVFINSLIEIGVKVENIKGFSIALAGGVDVDNKKWLSSPRIKAINNFNFNQLFNILPPIPYTFIEHDIHAQASSVLNLKSWQDDNYVFIHVGNGIGMSIFNKELFLGNRGFAGEIGHIPYRSSVNDKSLNVPIQNIEHAISTKGIINFVNENYGLSINSINEIPEGILEDSKLFDHVYNALKYLLIVATNILDPRTIIIGGMSIDLLSPKLQTQISEKLREETWAGGPENIRWYHHEDMFGAYGTILNVSKKIINSVIENELI